VSFVRVELWSTVKTFARLETWSEQQRTGPYWIWVVFGGSELSEVDF